MLGRQRFSSDTTVRTLYNTLSLRLTPIEKKKFPRKIINNILPEEYRRTACNSLTIFSLLLALICYFYFKWVMLCLIGWFSKRVWCIHMETLYWRAVKYQIPYEAWEILRGIRNNLCPWGAKATYYIYLFGNIISYYNQLLIPGTLTRIFEMTQKWICKVI